jgi:hypothetical protein
LNGIAHDYEPTQFFEIIGNIDHRSEEDQDKPGYARFASR